MCHCCKKPLESACPGFPARSRSHWRNFPPVRAVVAEGMGANFKDLLRSITVYDKCILWVVRSGVPASRRKSRQYRGGNRQTTRFLFLENVSVPANRIRWLGVSSCLALLVGLALADLYFGSVGLIVTSDASWEVMHSKLIPVQVLTALEITVPTVLFWPAWLGIRKLVQARAERLLCLGMIVAGFLFGVLVIQQRMLHLGL